jgi:hypothetical protein
VDILIDGWDVWGEVGKHTTLRRQDSNPQFL